MELKLNYEGFKENLIYSNIRPDFPRGQQVQYIFRFDNGYGASVIKGPYSFGGKVDLWELAVLEFGDGFDRGYSLCYSTDITNNVIGSLTDAGVRELLGRIAGLDAT